MKEEMMNYDTIYQEAASKVLLQNRQLRSRVEMNMNRLMSQLYFSIARYLEENPPDIPDTTGKINLRMKAAPDCSHIRLDLEIGLDNGEPPYQDSHLISIRSVNGLALCSTLEVLQQKWWFPKNYSREELHDRLQAITSLIETYEETSHHYANLETSHLVQFANYAKNRIEKEGIKRNTTHYQFLCTLDTFFTSEDEGFFSGQTMILIRRDWSKLVCSELASHIREAMETPNSHDVAWLRENLSHPVFLSCKVGSYYP